MEALTIGGRAMSRLVAEFTVVGKPVPQGSTRAFSRGGRIHTTNDPTGTIERWRGDIRSAFRPAPDEPVPQPWQGAISMRLAFRLPRPKSHFLPANSRRPEPVLRPDAPFVAEGGPDLDKLARAVLDALTGQAYVDDAQVASLATFKAYPGVGQQPGVDVRVEVLR